MRNFILVVVVALSFFYVGFGQTEEGTYERFIEDNFVIKVVNSLESKNFDSLDKKKLESKKVFLKNNLWNSPGCELFILKFFRELRKDPSKCLDVINESKVSYDTKKIAYIKNNFNSIKNYKFEENDTLFKNDFCIENGKVIFKTLKNLKIKTSKISLDFEKINEKLVYERNETLDSVSKEVWNKIKPEYDYDLSSVLISYTITNKSIDFVIYFYSSDIDTIEIKDPNLN